MSMKEILVHLDNTDRCQTRLDVAVSLSISHQAHLTGVYATPPPYYAVNWVDPPPEILEMEKFFRKQTASAGIDAEWICTDELGLTSSVSDRMTLQAHYADLVIVGQADPDAGIQRKYNDLAERMALGTGRPVLVIPRFGEFETVGQRVMLAWRGGKASARALNDAIHFLEEAQQVNLLMINPDDQFEVHEKSLCTYMAHHGVMASVDRLSVDDVHAGDVLLNQACDLGVDMVVLGVVAHKRLGKIGLGSVGKHFLEHMTIPVLMSH